MSRSEAKRQHPAMVAMKALKEGMTIAVYLLAFYSLGSGDGIVWSIGTFLIFVYVVVLLISNFLRWMLFTYTLTPDGVLRVQQGIFLKRRRSVHPAMVQAVEIEAGILHQLLGVVSLGVETSGGESTTDIFFSALSRKEAERLQTALRPGGKVNPETTSERAVPDATSRLYSLSLGKLACFGATSGKIGYLIALVFALHEQLPTEHLLFVDEQIVNTVGELENQSLIFLALTILLVSWVLSTALQMVQYAGFKVDQQGELLIVRYGLLKKKSHSIPKESIRSVTIKENILRQLAGVVSVHVEFNRGRAQPKSETLLLFPIVPKANVHEELAAKLPKFSGGSESLFTPPLRSLHRYIIRSGIFAALIMGFAYWQYEISVGPQFSAVLLLLFAVFGYLDWKYSGIGWQRRLLTIRSGSLNLKTMVIPRRALQGIEFRSHFFQQRAGLTTLAVLVSSGRGTHAVAHLDVNEAERAIGWFQAAETARLPGVKNGPQLPVQRPVQPASAAELLSPEG